MQKICTLLLFLWIFIAGSAQTKYFKGELKGSSEVPANAATGFGVVLAKYNMNSNELVIRGDYQGLTGNLTATHIHNAAAGLNGPVLYNLVNPGSTSGSLSLTVDLTDAEEVELLAGRIYANVHTASFPGGELRAQLMPATVGQGRYLQVNLSGANEVPPTPSGATGVLYGLLDKGENKLYVTGRFSGLTSDANAAHIHTASAGSNGSVTFPLSITTGVQAGVFSTVATVNSTQIADIEAGNTYVNVHTTDYSGGEIRGQLAVVPDPQIIYFKGLLAGANEVPPVAAPGSGVVLVQYDLGTNSFILTGDYQNLTSVASASHVHNAVAGVNGPVLFDVTNTGLLAGSLFANTILTDAQESELLAGRFYVNVHTATNPGGEIRAQLTQTTEGQTTQLSGLFSGANEVPANSSTATGAVVVLLDKGTNMLYVTGAFTGLTSASTMAHLHNAPAGENGPVVFNLNFTPGFMLGVLSLATSVTPQQIALIEAGQFYANVHTVNFPGGEIRAQIGVGNALPVKLISFNGHRSGDNVKLTWTVENQQNFKDFTVEQLNDKTSKWSEKGIVAGNNLSGTQNYTFNDQPILGPNILLYRLKMTDLDGKKSYSSIVKINFKNGKAQLTLLSNPVKSDLLRFQLTGIEQTSQAQAMVVDISGKLLLRSTNLRPGTNELNVSSLASGMYKLIVLSGSDKIETSFIK